jgi:hypothetical protein
MPHDCSTIVQKNIVASNNHSGIFDKQFKFECISELKKPWARKTLPSIVIMQITPKSTGLNLVKLISQYPILSYLKLIADSLGVNINDLLSFD